MANYEELQKYQKVQADEIQKGVNWLNQSDGAGVLDFVHRLNEGPGVESVRMFDSESIITRNLAMIGLVVVLEAHQKTKPQGTN